MTEIPSIMSSVDSVLCQIVALYERKWEPELSSNDYHWPEVLTNLLLIHYHTCLWAWHTFHLDQEICNDLELMFCDTCFLILVIRLLWKLLASSFPIWVNFSWDEMEAVANLVATASSIWVFSLAIITRSGLCYCVQDTYSSCLDCVSFSLLLWLMRT